MYVVVLLYVTLFNKRDEMRGGYENSKDQYGTVVPRLKVIITTTNGGSTYKTTGS